MEKTKQHIVFKIIAALVVIALLIPTTIKLFHSFEHHKHTSCENRDIANFHKCEMDCPFFKYNFQQYDLKSENYKARLYTLNNLNISPLKDYFFYNHLVLPFSLRGPPTLV